MLTFAVSSLLAFQVAFYYVFTFAPHAGAGTRLAAQKQALLQSSCFNCVKTNPSSEGFVFTSQKLVLLRRPRFLCLAKEKEAKEGDCGHRFGFAKLPSLRTVFRAGSPLAASPLRTCKPLFPEKPRSARLCQQTDGKTDRFKGELTVFILLDVQGYLKQ